MEMRGWRSALIAALVLPVTAGAPAAQTARSGDEARACLCQEQLLSSLNNDVQAQSKAYEEKRQVFEALDKQVQTQRPQVNVKSQADIDAFKQLLERRDAAADALNGQATSSYADVVKRYNEAVAQYNNNCAGKAFDPDRLGQERRDLACPKP
jgi:hypothetical protein